MATNTKKTLAKSSKTKDTNAKAEHSKARAKTATAKKSAPKFQRIKSTGKLPLERGYIVRDLGKMQIILTPENVIYTHIEGGLLVGGAERLIEKLGAKWQIESDEIAFKDEERQEIERIFKSPLMATDYNAPSAN